MSKGNTNGRTSIVAKGEFYCPSCDGRRPFVHKRVVRYAAFIIPRGEVGQYVECQDCQKTWNPKVLNYDPDATAQEFAAEFELAVRRVMVLMVMADGEVHKDEIKTIRRLYRQIANIELTRDEVWDEIAAARTDGRSVTDYLPELVGRLNDSGRELVLKAAILVAMADGRLGREEEAQLVEISKALEMSPERVQMIIAEMPALRSPPPPGF